MRKGKSAGYVIQNMPQWCLVLRPISLLVSGFGELVKGYAFDRFLGEAYFYLRISFEVGHGQAQESKRRSKERRFGGRWCAQSP